MDKNINSSEYTEETMLKLDIFRKCFRECVPFPVNIINIAI